MIRVEHVEQGNILIRIKVYVSLWKPRFLIQSKQASKEMTFSQIVGELPIVLIQEYEVNSFVLWTAMINLTVKNGTEQCGRQVCCRCGLGRPNRGPFI